MASQKGGGASFGILIGLILAIFIIIGLLYTTFSNNAAFHESEKKAEAARQDAADAEKREKEARREVTEISTLVWNSGTPDKDRIIKDYLKPAGEKLKAILEQEPLGSEGFAKDLNKDGKLQAKEYKYLLEIYNDLFVQLESAIHEMPRLRTEKAAALQELEAARGTARKEKAEVESVLDKERKEKSELNAKLLEDAKNFDADKRRLQEEKAAVEKEMAKQQEERLMEAARLESEIKRLEGRIVELTEKKKKTLADTDQDGEIVHADQRLGLAWINIGQKDRLRRGTVFDVFQYVKGGVKKSKGKVEVKSLEDDTAQVAILSQTDQSDPIVKGDFIASPFFDVKKQMVFVFVGEKLSNRSRYGMDELVRRIEETGGRVDKTVTIDTDFIVAIENAEQSDEFQKAVQFGVVIMREPELLEYLGR
jgi:hypothetical protein